MGLIGIITESKNEKNILDYFNESVKSSNIIFINENNINNIRNIKFDIIVLNKFFYENLILDKIQSNAGYILLNEDIIKNYNLVKNMKLRIITYGFNSKSTITASSISNDEILICIQRSIGGFNNNQIEPQEIRIKGNNKLNIYELMFIECIKRIYNRNKKSEKKDTTLPNS